jgi:GxxExxY protein
MVRRESEVVDGATLDDTSRRILGACYAVHSALGPGLLESAYEACLAHELLSVGSAVERQRTLPVEYRGVLVDAGYRIDLLVDNCVIVEVKSVKQLAPIHRAQLLTYLKLSGRRLGLLLNFNVPRMKLGIERLVNNFPDSQTRRDG